MREIMNESKCKAEAYLYGLLNDLVSDQDVIAWADSLIMEYDVPNDWLIDLCGCKKGESKKIIGILNSVKGTADTARINEEILSLYSNKTRPFSLYSIDELPDGFIYPTDLEKMAMNGGYVYNALVEWLDRKWSYMGRLLRHVQEVNPSFVPFAKLDDRFLCLDEKHEVYIADILEKQQVKVGSFGQWYADYVNEARQGVWHAGA
ncbi:hypothetical protein CWE12_01250 [Aliidiomarina sedimenti]|uniref:Uncharacterized protein n=1 Tax=Aliidiomarina sedimenti TaxID=1933879 RepID=A0ABY0C1W7_9GAMM|nr:hypothetical protein [Aliidiomarina sedimenti]RUO31654.1 hypothetical protein CWE12_01250 [Aliidiomarina sedimenti]